MAGKPIKINIIGDDSQLKKTLKGAAGKVEAFGKSVTKMGLNAGVVFAATATAIATKGVTAFADFEKGMNEVMTLLPEAGESAFGDLSDQVKDFSKEFGVLPDKVIPSLYQALSAGVPQDNVFEFLEVAQKAAKGGVTELETAVDGISSVVNAYGEEAISATEASDLMFTAVRLGKTNFEELSDSLFQVTPIAASLGVPFQDVTASIANLTAMGVPTSVAATQMKAALSEMGKEGTKANKAFQDLTGMGLTQFLAEEGNLQSAMAIMAEGAADAGLSVMDMFGSVEAGQAILALTADGGDAYGETLAAMSGSAGATQGAFETMDSGLSAGFDRIKANLAVLAINIGEKVAPYVEKATEFMLDAFDKLGPALVTAQGFVMNLKDEIVNRAGPVIKQLAETFDVVSEKVSAAFTMVSEYLTPGIMDLKDAVVDLVKKGLAKLSDLFKKIKWEKLWDGFLKVRDAIMDFARALPDAFRTAVEWIKENKKWLIVLGSAVGALVVGWYAYQAALAVVQVWTTAVAAATTLWNAALALNPVGIVVLAIVALVAALVAAYTQFEGFRDVVNAVAHFFQDNILPIFMFFWDTLIEVLSYFWTQIQEVFKLVKALFTGDFAQVWESFKALISNALEFAIGFFWELPARIIEAIGPLVSQLASWALDAGKAMLTGFGNWLDDSLIPWFKDLPGRMAGWLSTGMNALTSLGGDIGGWILDGMLSALGSIGSFLDDVWSDLYNFGKDLGRGLVNGLLAMWNKVDLVVDIEIPSWVPGVGGKGFGPVDLIPDVPYLAQGGIINSPTLSVIGEGREPEAIIPLSRAGEFGFGGGGITINVQAGIGTDGLAVGNQIVSVLKQWERANGSLPLSVSAA